MSELVWTAYKLGIALELPRASDLVSFFGDELLADPAEPWLVELTDGDQRPPEGDFALALAVTVRGRPTARLTAPPPGQQWDRGELIDQVADAVERAFGPGSGEAERAELLSELGATGERRRWRTS
jgi:hypothetical protein